MKAFLKSLLDLAALTGLLVLFALGLVMHWLITGA